MIPFLVAAAALLWAMPAAAQNVPSTMHYVGNLSDDGQAVDKTVSMTFELYDAKTGGSVVWSETKMTVDVNGGKFAAELGNQNPLDEVFDGNQYWLQVTVDGEAMTPRTPAGMSPYAARAGTVGQVDYDNSNSGLGAQTQQAAIDELKAKIDSLESQLQNKADQSALADKADKSTLQNDYAKKSQLSNYVTKTSAQSTYATQSDLSNKADKSSLNDYLTKNQAMMTYATQSQLSNYYTKSTADSTFATQSSLSNYYTKTTADSTFASKSSLSNYYTKSTADSTFAQKNKVSSIDTRVSDLEQKTQDMSRKLVDGQYSVVFDDVNVHIRNGQGTSSNTDQDGNLIIGYNENPGTQSGSHNLVIGDGHTFSSYGGIVAGEDHEITAKYASVVGGLDNHATAAHATVAGGTDNIASGKKACVVGGDDNEASASESSVFGGYFNDADGDTSVTTGGSFNTSSSTYEWCGAGTCR
jgi:hypothetical protein